MSGRAAHLALWTGVLLMIVRVSGAQQVLYGGNQWLQVESANTGWLVRVDPETGASTPIGKPAGVARLSGLAFDEAGTLWASTVTGTPSGTLRTSTLITLNPADGSLLSTIGPILDGPGGAPMGIESLAIQPGTDALFGTRGISDQNLVHAADIYRIDKATGVATLYIDNNNANRESSIAFAPDGSLYQTVSTCCAVFGGNPRFQILEPSSGAVQKTWPAPKYFKALAVGEDGVLFGAAPKDILGTDVSELYRIDPGTGVADLIGETGHNPIGALVFGPNAAPSCTLDDSCSEPRSPVLRTGAEHPGPRGVVRPPP